MSLLRCRDHLFHFWQFFRVLVKAVIIFVLVLVLVLDIVGGVRE